MRHRLTRRADDDIEQILRETLRAFGPRQVQAYAALIEKALALVAEAPERPASRSRPDLAPGVRSFSVALASRRKQGAAHSVYFTVVRRGQADEEVVILRVLHDRMEPRVRLAPGQEPQDPDEPSIPEI